MINHSLEATWSNLDKQEHSLKLEQKYLKEIWIKVCEQQKENEAMRDKLEVAKLEEGIHFVDPKMLIKLNIGGQEFETSAGVLCRDEYSILAGICRGSGDVLDSRLESDPTQGSKGTPSFFIDRDWWIFRHILQFLRTDVLPEDPLLVEEMYNEASFYRLRILKHAIDKLPQAFFARKPSKAEHINHGDRPHLGYAMGLENNPYVKVCNCGKNEGCRLCNHQNYMQSPQVSHRQSGHRASGRSDGLPDPFGFTVASHTRPQGVPPPGGYF